MKLHLLLFLFFSFSFYSQNNKYEIVKNGRTVFYLENSNNYSKHFLDYLKSLRISKNIILENDTVKFSDIGETGYLDLSLDVNQEKYYSDKQNKIKLIIKRINYSSIYYNLQTNNSTIKGVVDGGLYIFGEESDYDSIEGKSFICSEYVNDELVLKIEYQNYYRVKLDFKDSTPFPILYLVD